jgi:uncharacterized protein (TIGR02001 family)
VKKLWIIIACALFATAPNIQAQEHQVSFDVDAVSRYIWRGFDLSDNNPALQPSLTYTHGESGIWVNAWLSMQLKDREKVATPNEFDITIGWDKSLNDLVGITLGYIQYTFPDAVSGVDTHSEEIFAGLVTDNLGINPYGTLFVDFGALEGLYFNAGVAIPIGRELAVPLTLDVSMGMQNYDAVDKGGMSDLNIGITTSLGTEQISFHPGIYWTITGMDEVNEDDEIWVKLGVSFSN